MSTQAKTASGRKDPGFGEPSHGGAAAKSNAVAARKASAAAAASAPKAQSGASAASKSSAPKAMSGMTAAAYAAYALSDASFIYPITPASRMAETMEAWSAAGRLNLMGQACDVTEMQSEKGVAGAVHGSLAGGALTSTFTASQGLMLMIPNMYKISGELLPGVFHITCRSLSAHALSIFGDHQDLMAVRAAGFAMLASASVQECMDLSWVAHLAAIEGSLPFVHFFDGFRTSDEIASIETIEPEAMASYVPWDKVEAFRRRAMDPQHPNVRGTAQNPDVYFQNREAPNRFYDALPDIVQEKMDQVAEVSGRQYHLFDYVGASDAEYVVCAMASACDVLEETVRYLAAKGKKVGLVKVRLYRPFAGERFMEAVPATTKVLCALDRTKEPGSQGEPLYLDVCAAVLGSGRMMRVIGGRYGLSSKDFTPTMAKAVFDNMATEAPKNRFTVGIRDDVTLTSLPEAEPIDTLPAGTGQYMFYGFGSDGTVGANKQAATIVGDHGGRWVQEYSWFDSKKSGGLTISYLRFADGPIRSPYLISGADYVACHKDTYVKRGYPMADALKPGGIFVLNCPWTDDELDAQLPANLKRTLARKQAKLYVIDASKLAADLGLGVRINMIMEAVFFKLSGVMDYEEAVGYLKESIKEAYASKGADVVAKDCKAVDQTADRLRAVDYPAHWGKGDGEAVMGSAASKDSDAFGAHSVAAMGDGRGNGEAAGAAIAETVADAGGAKNAAAPAMASASAADNGRGNGGTAIDATADAAAPASNSVSDDPAVDNPADKEPIALEPMALDAFLKDIFTPVEALKGNDLPVSALDPAGIVPSGTCAYEKRQVAYNVPRWDPKACIQCYQCSLVCPHAAIRPFLAHPEELKGAPEGYVTVPARMPALKGMDYRVQVFPQDCVGCGSCADNCPAPGKALFMEPLATQLEVQKENLAFAQANITVKDDVVPADTVPGTQLQQPLLEFSGACAGCGETPYVKLLTQLFGDRLIMANATGCSSIWGAYMPAMPYTVNRHGRGPAWGNSLFEDNGEFGFGIARAVAKRRTKLEDLVRETAADASTAPAVKGAMEAWLEGMDDPAASLDLGDAVCDALLEHPGTKNADAILGSREMFQKKSVWAVGGDGWAYDIGYGGLDEVMAKNQDLNVLVLDTEGYSNTGGEMSKATQLGSVSGFTVNGKPTPKKNLGRMMMDYGYVYVAHVAMGANMQQLITALREAEAYPGPSIVIALCPCISWGLKAGMATTIRAEREAVKAGYWPLYRYNPLKTGVGEEPLTIDYKAPDGSLAAFLSGQNRYASLAQRLPELSTRLQSELAKDCEDLYGILTGLTGVYGNGADPADENGEKH